MSTIYKDQPIDLKELLSMGSHDATLLIPELQRPYIWDPLQVIRLMDSLIRGWPFGTLLIWKVKDDDPVMALARTFWWMVDRTGPGSEPISRKNPPATYYMMLDGQQRVQSLLLALSGDGWGLKMWDRDWNTALHDAKSRGPQSQRHWSLGCLCVDLLALADEYLRTKRLVSVDFTKVLKWVVMDEANGHSKLPPPNYKHPLPRAEEGKFVRLSRLWQEAPEHEGVEPEEAEKIAAVVLTKHGVADQEKERSLRSLGLLLMTLARVKQIRVTYLEIAEYNALSHGTRDTYNDAIVNIFTRLNSAGRILTLDDITFAWLKIGWTPLTPANEGAARCFDRLAEELDGLWLPRTENLVSAISFLWSVAFNDGKLLNSNDLLKGEEIRPMAKHISEHWDLVVEAASHVCELVKDRGLRFNEHYHSLNALAFLWAWYFGALRWRKEHNLRETQKDEFGKRLDEALDTLVDRWLICSQWAGRWAVASAGKISGYARDLSTCLKGLQAKGEVVGAVDHLRQYLETEVKGLEPDALERVRTMSAPDRKQVRISYYTPLWIWNQLDKDRRKMAKIILREQGTRRRNSLEVDHIVAWDLWQTKLKGQTSARGEGSTATSDAGSEELGPAGNELGNCLLLDKNFNISKKNKPLKDFLDRVYDFKRVEDKIEIEDWAKALDLEMAQVDSANTSADVLQKIFVERTARIRRDLEEFVRGTKSRVDIELS